MSALDDALRAAEQSAANEAAAWVTCSGRWCLPPDQATLSRSQRARSWTLRDILAGEKESLEAFEWSSDG